MLRGKIITVDANDSIVEALAVSAGKIVAIGASDDIARLVGAETRVIELQGRTVTPGLIDTHNHFAWSATDTLFSIDLVYPAVKSITTIKDPEIIESHWLAYQRAQENKQLPIRVFTLWREPHTFEGAQASILPPFDSKAGP